MALNRTLAALSFLALPLIACGGTITGNNPDGAGAQGGSTGQGGAGGSSPTGPCSTLDACECLAAAGRCVPQSEACWCPTECYPGAPIDCVCGGGRFLACQDDTVVASCAAALTAVQNKCTGQPFVQYISALCSTAGNPSCVAGCLANLAATGSCSEIDCGFCTVCDCAGPATPSPFASCLAACAPPLPER